MTRSEKRASMLRNPAGINSTTEGQNKMAKLTTAEGSTRGKNPRKITFKKFDREVTENLPKDLAEFLEVTKEVNDGKPYTQVELLDFVLDGFNAAMYSAASDEIGEFIPDSWSKDDAAQFRLAVRNMSKVAQLSIEDTVNLLKPAVEKGILAKKAAQAAAETVPA